MGARGSLEWAFAGSVVPRTPGPEKWLAPIYFVVLFGAIVYTTLLRKLEELQAAPVSETDGDGSI